MCCRVCCCECAAVCSFTVWALISLLHRYDKEGADGVGERPKMDAGDPAPLIDSAHKCSAGVFFAMIFGSEHFEGLVGQMKVTADNITDNNVAR